MKAIAFRVIDGIEIVLAIAEPTIDPELTKQRARETLRGTPEYQALSHAYQVLTGRVEASEEAVDAAAEQLAQGGWVVDGIYRSLLRSDPVYFYVPGEINVDDDRAAALAEQLRDLQPREALTTDGQVIPDHRGRVAWRRSTGRWESAAIHRIGEGLPDGHRWSEDLTESELLAIHEQVDRDRIEAMSDGERRAHADHEINAALDGMAHQHTRTQISGAGPSLADLRAEFELAKNRIFQRYKISSEVGDNGGQQHAG